MVGSFSSSKAVDQILLSQQPRPLLEKSLISLKETALLA
jgi:hypothetical protein